MADNKPNYTISTLGIMPVVKFTDGVNTEYSPVFGNGQIIVAGAQEPALLVNVPSVGGIVLKQASLCVWESFQAPA